MTYARFLIPAIFVLSAFASNSVADELQLDIRQAAAGVSFRAIKVSPTGVIIAGGTGSTIVRSDDRLTTWKTLTVPTSDDLDFRDLEFVGDRQWVLMSAGPGELSRLFQSADNGETWKESHRNTNPKGFYNGIAFGESGRGLLVGDPIDGRLTLLETQDAGQTWTTIPGPKVVDGEYGFAASGSGIVCGKNGRCLIATGGARAQVLTSVDYGKTWQESLTKVRQGNASSGFFSIAEHPSGSAVAVGGDYKNPQQAAGNYAFRSNISGDWTVGDSLLPHKACVKFLTATRVLCVGRTGIALSEDAGRTWQAISDESFYTFDVDSSNGDIYLAGANGRMAHLRLPKK